MEFLFFDRLLGITPTMEKPQIAAPGSKVYPAWIAKAEVEDLTTEEPPKPKAVVFELHDALFRTASCVLLPEGEAPTDSGTHESISSVGLLATLLRYNEEYPGKRLLIAGHADRAASADYNQTLSEQRAQVVLALILGDRDSFIKLCDARRNYVGPDKIDIDITQIFDWTTRAFGFSCKPTDLTRPPNPTRYQQFRESFNHWVETVNPTIGGDAHAPPKLALTGMMDKTIWGAFFDLYECNLQDELGETPAEVQKLRDGAKWVDNSKKWLGFGERHPTKDNTIDGTRSQEDRRVEVLLFDATDAPDLATDNGEDIYDGESYEKRQADARVSARRGPLHIAVYVGAAERSLCGELIVTGGGMEVLRLPLTPTTTTANGFFEIELDAKDVAEPLLIRQEFGYETRTLMGPCSPLALRSLLATEQPNVAGTIVYTS